MKRDTFNYFWDNIIVKCINDTEEKYNSLYPGVLTKLNLERLKKRVKIAYDDCKKTTKQKYYTNINYKDKIDNHKIASCMTFALLKAKPFTYDISSKSIPHEIMYVNYEVAFYSGIGILYCTLINYYKVTKNKEYMIKLISQKNFIYPETTPGHDSYVKGRILTLALNDIYGNDFDILTYADMLFWIEHYNRQSIENKFEIQYENIEKLME